MLGHIPLRNGGPLPLESIRRILIIRLDGIGDYLLFTPFLRELRRAVPDFTRICLVTTPELLELANRNPHIDDALSFQFGIGRMCTRPGVGPPSSQFVELMRCRRKLRAFQPDLAIVPRWDIDSPHPAMLSWLSGARRRIGYGRRPTTSGSPNNQSYKALLSVTVPATGPPQHEVLQSLALLRVLGAAPRSSDLEVHISEQEREWAASFVIDKGHVGRGPLIALGVGARHRKRRWPVENFVTLGRRLVETHGAHLLVVGGADDVPISEEIVVQIGDSHVISTVGLASLGQAAALLSLCSLFIGNDSAPMHLAAAVAVPVVELSCHAKTGDIFDANSPVRFGPWGVAHTVLCPTDARPPCTRNCSADVAHCIQEIHVTEVAQAAARLLTGCVSL